MAITPFGDILPTIHPTAYVHPSVEILGDVTVGEDTSIWPTCVLRGDSGAVRIGARTSFQDASIAHATMGLTRTSVGSECTIGHRVIVHGCTVGNRVLVGMASTLLDDVVIGDECFIAAGSLIPPGRTFEPRSFIMGAPAKRVREVSAKDLEWIERSWKTYFDLMKRYRDR